MISASAVERLWHCSTSSVLPQVLESSDASEQGTRNHAELESQIREFCKTGELPKGKLGEMLSGAKVLACERSFVVDVLELTIRDLGESIGRSYGQLGDAEIACTVDLVLQLPSGVVQVIDWKSRARVTEAAENWQIKTQALCVSLWLKVEEIEGGLCYLDNWHTNIAKFDCFDIASIASDLVSLTRAIAAATPNGTTYLGSWCDYCPAQHSCPGRAQIAKAGMAVVDRHFGDVPVERYGEIWAQLEAAAKAIDAAREIIKAQARRTPLLLPSGKRLAAVECERNGVDGKACEALLTANGIAVPMKVSRYTQLKVIK
jgi:PD-(D/E)XK nuclease superfamily